MATGTFTYNALRTKTLKERIKTHKNIVSHSNSTRALLLVQERLPLNHTFPYAYVGLVWFARYCGKIYSRYLFPYGGLQSQARTIVDMSTRCRHVHVRLHYFILTEAFSCTLDLAYFAGKIAKNRLVCKNAVALAYYGSFRLLVMGSWL